MKKYFSKRLQTFSGSLKATRVLKRLPHSLRSFAITDFLFSGSLKNRFSKLFKLCLITIFTFSAHPIFAQNDLDKTYHYTPGPRLVSSRRRRFPCSPVALRGDACSPLSQPHSGQSAFRIVCVLLQAWPVSVPNSCKFNKILLLSHVSARKN